MTVIRKTSNASKKDTNCTLKLTHNNEEDILLIRKGQTAHSIEIIV